MPTPLAPTGSLVEVPADSDCAPPEPKPESKLPLEFTRAKIATGLPLADPADAPLTTIWPLFWIATPLSDVQPLWGSA